MARKAREQEAMEGWAMPRVWFASAAYSLPKLSSLLSHSAKPLLLLHLPEAHQAHPLTTLAPLAQQLLLSPRDNPSSVVVLFDISPLLSRSRDPSAALDAEGRTTALGHDLGKPASRVICKLLGSGLNNVTLLAVGGACQLALKLLSATSDERAISRIDRLVLIHPRLPAACVNTQLANKHTPPHLAQLRLDLLSESETALDRRLPALRSAFPNGAAGVATGELASLLAHAASCDGEELGGSGRTPLPRLEAHDAERIDSQGRSLWICALSFSLSRQTKQLEISVDNAAHLLEKLSVSGNSSPSQAPSADSAAAQNSTADSSPSARSGEVGREIGALVLRGSRCVLVRSLSKPPAWKGVRIPSVKPREEEAAHDAAVRAATELCDIDPVEVLVLPSIPPAVVYRADGRMMWVYALYAARPPPAGPLEDQDQSDDEDLYDWFTYPRAMAALRDDSPSVSALRAMSITLRSAASAGSLPDKWGGVFGQEFVSTLDVPQSHPSPVSHSEGEPQSREQLQLVLDQLPLPQLIEFSAAAAAAAASRFQQVGCSLASETEAPKFRALRPFHPARLQAALLDFGKGSNQLRLDGLAWLATQPNLQAVIRTDDAGVFVVEPGDPWWACIPRSKWPAGLAEEIAPLWHEPNGDRQTELSLHPIKSGTALPEDARDRCLARLEASLLTEVESALPLSELQDPFAEVWAPVLRESAELERAAKIADDVKKAFTRARRPRQDTQDEATIRSSCEAASLCRPCT